MNCCIYCMWNWLFPHPCLRHEVRLPKTLTANPIGDANPRYFHLVHSSEWLFLLPASPENCDPVGSQEYFHEGKRRSMRTADNLTTFICRVSWNLGASTSWKPQGLSKPLMGLHCFYTIRWWKSELLYYLHTYGNTVSLPTAPAREPCTIWLSNICSVH
jgi:hypothetical protein